MNITGLISKAGQLANANSTTILTAMGVSGTMTTAYLSGRASWHAADRIKKEEDRIYALQTDPQDLTTKERVKLVWPLYIPAATTGALTISAIILANQISSRKLAAVVAASGVTERAFQEYKDKVVEKLGPTKDVSVRDAVAQDRVNRNPPSNREIILAGTGEVLCYDQYSGRYFQSTVEEIKRAENKLNFDIFHHLYASLSSFYDEIGLTPTSMSDDVGWSTDQMVSVHISTVMSTDNRPCAAIDFSPMPQPGYQRLY